MADKLNTEQRSELMSRIKGKDTHPEIIVRRLVHAMGYRYRLHADGLPGKPDLVFRSRRKIIFVHGCFWHQHPGCKDNHIPKSNIEYWAPKLERTKIRDAKNRKKLIGSGWDVLVIWACQLDNLKRLKARILQFLGA